MIILQRRSEGSTTERRTKAWISKCSDCLSHACALVAQPTDFLCSYWAYKNAWSMDGLPGMQRGLKAGQKYGVVPLKKMVGPLAPTSYRFGYGFTTLQVFLIALMSFFIGLAVAYYGSPVAQAVVDGLKGSPLEVNIGNLTHGSSLEGITGLWSTR